ncbi:DUF2274 domain-containing protein [uncultured Sphingomonas sp.]|uniref:DUF2274 domain-containing protein n=1 Tax=uncultured Sphingomonas sp. TaxID=158754 RepID=UPI00338DBDD8
MANLKLGKLPDRTPAKLTITITPDLQTALQAYAGDLYRHLRRRGVGLRLGACHACHLPRQ